MRRIFGLMLFVVASATAAPSALAEDFCADMRAILGEAPTEFASLRGEAITGPSGDVLVFSSSGSLGLATSCVVAQVISSGKPSSTSYTCSPAAPDTEAGMKSLTEDVSDCLAVTMWDVQMQGGQAGARTASYGMLRLSVTRNGDFGLAFGVEAFRDEHGQVMGSTTRGNRTEGNGSQRCTAKSTDEIAALFAMYGSRPGATRFENRQFVGYTNSVTAPTVAFVTKPNHPAHPAIMVRNVSEKNGATAVSASGDFAGDCEAFHALLQEVKDMNAGLARQ